MKNIKTDKANLEKKRGLFFQIGFIIVFSVLLLAFEWESEVSKTNKAYQLAGIDLETEIIPVIRTKELKPPMPKQFIEYKIVEDDKTDIKEPELVSTEIDPGEAYAIPVIGTAPEEDEPEIFIFTEVPPEFPGGIKGLQHYIAKNTKYPNRAIETGMQGKVYVRFVINEKGELENAHVLRSVDPLLDKEALRVVLSLPNWKPGKQGGKTVKVWFTVPIVFVLK